MLLLCYDAATCGGSPLATRTCDASSARTHAMRARACVTFMALQSACITCGCSTGMHVTYVHHAHSDLNSTRAVRRARAHGMHSCCMAARAHRMHACQHNCANGNRMTCMCPIAHVYVLGLVASWHGGSPHALFIIVTSYDVNSLMHCMHDRHYATWQARFSSYK